MHNTDSWLPRSSQPGISHTSGIEVRDLAIHVGRGRTERTLVSGANLHIDSGTVTCVLGPSGAGKSTLLKVFAGLMAPAEGTAIVAGTDVSGLNDRESLRHRRDTVSLVYQQYNLFDTLSAQENAALSLELRGLSHRAAMRSAEEWIDSLGLAEVAGDRPATLSGGEQQRVAIARALAAHSPVLLADEPTGALDPDSADLVVDSLSEAAKQGMCCVVVTHSERVAARADRVVRFEDGALAA